MNAKLSRFLTCAGAALISLGASDAMAGDKYRKDFRRHDGQVVRAAAVDRDIRQHERDRRAFVAGAAVQQHRNDNGNYYRGGNGNGYRDGYGDRYRDRYYDDHDDNDNKIGAVLVGAAVGAVVTGVVMSNKNSNSSTSSDSK
jgi:hypothetical protein